MTVDESNPVVHQLGEVVPDEATDTADERPGAPAAGRHSAEWRKNGITVERLERRLGVNRRPSPRPRT